MVLKDRIMYHLLMALLKIFVLFDGNIYVQFVRAHKFTINKYLHIYIHNFIFGFKFMYLKA